MSRTLVSPLLSTSLTLPSAQEPAYIFTLTHTPTTLAALTSTSTLHLLSPTTFNPQGTLKTPHTHLTALSSSILATAGGGTTTITLHDLRTSRTTLTIPTTAPTSSLSASLTGLLATGTELTDSTATVLLYDPRNPSLPLRTYKESHTDDVTALCFSADSTLLASGATDGLLNIFSLTASPGQGRGESDDEVDGAVRAVLPHGSVQRCGFLDGAAWALSHDEDLSFYDSFGEGETRGVGDVRGVLGCEYAIDLLPRGDGRAWVVDGNKMGAGWVDLVPIDATGKWGEGGFRLEGGHGGEVCRSVVVDFQAGVVFTGGEDGIVKAWRPPTETTTPTTEMEVEEQGQDKKKERRKEKKDKKKKKKKDDDKKRYKPY